MIPNTNIPIHLPKVPSVKRKHGKVELPLRLVLYLVRTGTRNGNQSNLIMGDELVAMGLAKGLEKVSPLIEKTYVLPYSQSPPEDVNAFFFLHHDIPFNHPEVASDRPAWLWVQNAGFGPISLTVAKWKREYYTNVFHAGKTLASRSGFHLLDFGIEDETLFKPTLSKDTDGIVFVGNLVVHQNAIESFQRLSSVPEFKLYGRGWSDIGIRNYGVVPQDDVPNLLSSAKVCLDTVSSSHLNEGMTSTRIYQILACESVPVTVQNPDHIPKDLHKHIVFAQDHDDMVRKSIDLLNDPIGRNRIRQGARKAVLNHTMISRARQAWSIMEKDIERLQGNA